MKDITEIIIKHRSFVGILGLIAILYLSEPSPKSVFIGFFFIIAGMFFRGWSSGYLNKDNELATHGPFALTRNPLYFGNLILGIGIAVAGNNICCYTIFLVYYLLFFPFLMVVEHKRMKKKFGKQYEEWAKKSYPFFPKIKKIGKQGFNISFYMKNREYKVLYFSLLVIAVFVFKVIRTMKH